jgi:hypothetical protein
MTNEMVINEETDPLTEKIKEANISLIINNYNDIFSSFDPRPFQERALSDDFLQECRRAARDKQEALELRILVPKQLRNQREEWKIKKRLKDHFEHHSKLEGKKLLSLKKEGFLWTILGIAILASVLFGFIKLEDNIWASFLAILEVPCWFLIWEGMGKIFIDSREVEPENEFYIKMSAAEINFADY